jgi:site-specific recombinase XerD
MKVSFYLTRPQSDTETSIFALINYEGLQVKYYTTESILPIHWNKETKRAKKSLREHPEFNERLNRVTADIQTIYRKYLNDHQNKVPHPDRLKALLDKELKKIERPEDLLKSFFPFFKSIIELSKTGGRVQPGTGKRYSDATIQVYQNTYNRLKEFEATRKRKIDFNTIDIDFYTEFTEYLTKRLKLATNTIGKDIKTLKTILNEATDRGINSNLQFKAKKFSTTSETTDSIYLTESELKEIGELDLSNKTRLEAVRDLFLVGCYTGLRFSDFSILKPDQMKDGFIEIKEQTKTGNPVVIPIHSEVSRIVAKYNGELPRAISNQRFNDYLKEIGELVKSLEAPFERTITKGGLKVSLRQEKYKALTTHTARRSFATNEYLNGMPTLTIMAITGHRTEKAFMRYIKLTPTDHAKLMKLHWEKRNKLRAV